MQTKFIIFNPLSDNRRGKAAAYALKTKLDGKLRFLDITAIDDYQKLFCSMTSEDMIIICGGDGTLNRFINDTASLVLPTSIYYYPAGSGNDFAHDIGLLPDCMPICIDKYIKGLPRVYVNGIEKLFINGIGFGVDGYCCEVGDKQRARSDKQINYTAIAIKGLLFYYKPTNATVVVDGVEKHYKNVWIAPTMNGRFYGGGIMPTPAQNRLDPDKTLSFMVLYGSGKLKTLTVFPSLFKGEHLSHTEMVDIITGKDITVKFDRPTALQIDGETVLGVTEYRAVAGE